MALINTTTTGVLGSTFFGDGTGPLTVQQNGVTLGTYGNIPTFSTYGTTLQTVSGQTYTKVNFNIESFDTNNNYDTTNARFLPTVAGYYNISSCVYYTSNSSGYGRITLFKNGSRWTQGTMMPFTTVTGILLLLNTTIYLNGSTDYVEIYMWQSTGSSMSNCGAGSREESDFSGFLVKAA
jgi:hypothetical protein